MILSYKLFYTEILCYEKLNKHFKCIQALKSFGKVLVFKPIAIDFHRFLTFKYPILYQIDTIYLYIGLKLILCIMKKCIS